MYHSSFKTGFDHKAQLETSGYFGARFQECAGRALLLTKRKLTERMPLWMRYSIVMGWGNLGACPQPPWFQS